MLITLTPEQEFGLKPTLRPASLPRSRKPRARLIDDRIAEIADAEDDDDMEWAKPLVDEARAAIARGETITLEKHRARNAERLAALRR